MPTLVGSGGARTVSRARPAATPSTAHSARAGLARTAHISWPKPRGTQYGRVHGALCAVTPGVPWAARVGTRSHTRRWPGLQCVQGRVLVRRGVQHCGPGESHGAARADLWSGEPQDTDRCAWLQHHTVQLFTISRMNS